MKTIILGVGNPILSDDGVGIHVAQQLKHQLQDPNITISEAYTGGLNLLDHILGFDKAIIVDAVKKKDGCPGEVHRYSVHDFTTIHSCNPHDVSFPEAIKLARSLGEQRIPADIIIIGIHMPQISCEFGERLSTPIAQAIPTAINMILTEINHPTHHSS